MARTIGYRWHLRRLMADKDMYATTQLRPLLAERGVALSREQVYRLVTGVPERLSLATLAALCDILGCGPGDLVRAGHHYRRGRQAGRGGAGSAAAAGPGPGGRPGGPVGAVARCPAGHEVSSPRRGCLRCRRDQVVDMAAAAEGSLPRPVIEAAVEAVAPAGQALRQLTLALAADPGALSCGAPPVAGRLAAELIARGSATLAIPACAVCGRAGKPLFRGDGGGVCQRCRTWQLAAACASCGQVRPAAGRDSCGRPRACQIFCVSWGSRCPFVMLVGSFSVPGQTGTRSPNATANAFMAAFQP